MAGGDRRGFFAKLRSLIDEPEPEELRPAWTPPARAPAPASAPAAARRIRPPGALPEAAFLAACTRCGACVEACPADAITLDPAPALAPEKTPCILCATVPCAAACPTDIGALKPIAKDAIKLGVARVFDKLCINHHEADACEVCLDWCPVPGALVAGARGIPVVDASVCTGCGLCANRCAAYPHAIGVRPN